MAKRIKSIKHNDSDDQELKEIKIHYKRLVSAKNFEEFKLAQLTYVHMLIQKYEARRAVLNHAIKASQAYTWQPVVEGQDDQATQAD